MATAFRQWIIKTEKRTLAQIPQLPEKSVDSCQVKVSVHIKIQNSEIRKFELQQPLGCGIEKQRKGFNPNSAAPQKIVD